ncbi:MAG TPA: biotin/lipoyl-containing protein, partial [Burkholderiaceae bacterium]|nr:biotin/lipoyl-containing protein [Burkholderiaceae bacterium]
MEHVIKMPDIGEGIAEVELTAWHVKPGDRVVEDQALADVMTDKANVEIPSPVVGKVISLGGEVGKLLAVGSELIRIEVEGEGAVKPQAAPAPARAPAAEPAPAPREAPKRVDGERPIASPAVRRRAWELGIELRDVKPSGLGGRILQADLEAHAVRTPARAPQLAKPIEPQAVDETQAI